MATQHPCVYCHQFVMFADPNVTLENRTICPKCLQKHFPKASALLDHYNRHIGAIKPQFYVVSPITDKRPPSRSD